MNKYQKWLAVSIVLLAIAIVMPIYVLSTALNQTLTNVTSAVPDWFTHSQSTEGLNEQIRALVQEHQAAQTQLIIIVTAVEMLLVAGFSVTLWYAIKCRDQCRSFPPPT